jgi:hypothetical protein
MYRLVDADFSAAWIKLNSAEMSPKELMVDMMVSMQFVSSVAASLPASV